MRLPTLLLLLLLGAGTALGQSSWPPPYILSVNPVGACANGMFAVNIVAGTLYYCAGNTWHISSGGGGTIGGNGTANTLAKFSAATTIADSASKDDGTNPAYNPTGWDIAATGRFMWGIPNNAVTGTTVNKMACNDGTGKAIICDHTASLTDDPFGVAVAGFNQAPGKVGNTGICSLGYCTVVFDNAATAEHFAQISSTVDGELHDVGVTAPTNGASYWSVATGNAGAGTTGVIRQLAPSELNAAANGNGGGSGKGTAVQVNGTQTKSIANFNGTTPAIPGGNTGITFQSSNSGNTTSISAYFPTPAVSAASQGPFYLTDCIPDASGNVFYTTFAFTNWNDAHWEWAKGIAADTKLYCKVIFPHVLPSGTAKIVLPNLSANDNTAGHTMTFKTGDIIPSTTMNVGAPTFQATQNFTTTTTAYAPSTLTFGITSTPAADAEMIVIIDATTASSLANNVFLEPPYLEFQ